MPERDGAGEGVIVVSISRDKLPGIGGVGFDLGVYIHLNKLTFFFLYPLHMTRNGEGAARCG